MVATHIDPSTVELALIFIDGHQIFTLVALSITAIILVVAAKHF